MGSRSYDRVLSDLTGEVNHMARGAVEGHPGIDPTTKAELSTRLQADAALVASGRADNRDLIEAGGRAEAVLRACEQGDTAALARLVGTDARTVPEVGAPALAAWETGSDLGRLLSGA